MSHDTPEITLDHMKITKTGVKMQFGMDSATRMARVRFPEGSTETMRLTALRAARHLKYVCKGSPRFADSDPCLLIMKLRRGDVKTLHMAMYHTGLAVDRHNRDLRNASKPAATAPRTHRRPSRPALGTQTA